MENNLSDNRAEKVTASSKHRWAEHGGALVLCGRAGNSACKKLLGACANTTAFFFFREKRMVVKDTVKDRTLVAEDDNNPTLVCLLPFVKQGISAAL